MVEIFRRQCAALLLTLPAAGAGAATIEVTVLDRDGNPVPDVAVYLESPAFATADVAADANAIMDQYERRFVPHLLVVQAGTPVDFPNSDVIAHHVYSFSHPNAFKLPIYKGDAYPPLKFDEAGLVILGCNIHDNMLGYILVVDTPYFTKTDDDGNAVIEADLSGDADVTVWSPRIRDDTDSLVVGIRQSESVANVTIRLTESLRPAHHGTVESLSWTDY